MAINSELRVDQLLATLAPDSEWLPNTARALDLLHNKYAMAGARRRSRTWAAAAAMAVCLSVMVLPEPRALAQRCLNCTMALWQNLGTPAPTAAGLTPAKDRRQAPDFTLTDASGHAVTLSALKGKVVVLNFWATWCGGCKVEIPWFMEFQQAYGNRDFAVLGISFDEDGWNAVRPFVTRRKINYRVMLGNDQVAARYGGIAALPITFLIDRGGRIAATHVGLPAKSSYKAEIDMLLKAGDKRVVP